MKFNTRKITIDKDQLCICGSGIEYGACCMKKGNIYEAMIIDNEGTELIYNQSEVISGVKSLLNFIELRVNSGQATLSYEESKRKLKKLFEKLDTALKPIGRIASCKTGCDHCCHLLVSTSKLEYEMINEYLKQNFSEEKIVEIKENIKKYGYVFKDMKHENEKFSEEDSRKYISQKIPCGFLSKENKCIIYEVRPFICRKYLVFNTPESCSNPLNKTNQYYAKYLTTTKDTIAKLNKLTYNSLEYKHILAWFVE